MINETVYFVIFMLTCFYMVLICFLEMTSEKQIFMNEMKKFNKIIEELEKEKNTNERKNK